MPASDSDDREEGEWSSPQQSPRDSRQHSAVVAAAVDPSTAAVYRSRRRRYSSSSADSSGEERRRPRPSSSSSRRDDSRRHGNVRPRSRPRSSRSRSRSRSRHGRHRGEDRRHSDHHSLSHRNEYEYARERERRHSRDHPSRASSPPPPSRRGYSPSHEHRDERGDSRDRRERRRDRQENAAAVDMSRRRQGEKRRDRSRSPVSRDADGHSTARKVKFDTDTKVDTVDLEPETAGVEDFPLVADEEETLLDEEAALMEKRRRLKESIMAKYDSGEVAISASTPPTITDTPPRVSPVLEDLDTQSVFATEQDRTEEMSAEEEEINAADYNPDEDVTDLDRQKHHQAILDKISRHAVPQEIVHAVHQEAAEMEEDDDDDLFAPESTEPGDTQKQPSVKRTEFAPTAATVVSTMHDAFDDPEGYYRIVPGELLHGRYHVLTFLGKGVFSSVVRARDTKTLTKAGNPVEVAIKIIRNNDVMFKAGQKELSILNKLQQADPDGRKHVIRVLDHFLHRQHLCIVFESMSMNLREVMKKFGGKKGLNIKAVRVYAQQLLLSLSLLRKCNILHADLKPDNILVNESKTILKLADLGSASDIGENDITPYLVSRFYRAPEIMLGLNYEFALDMWSVACTLFELYSGKILFPGHSNNHMLRLIMETKGRFPLKMLRGTFAEQHFENAAGGSFTFLEQVASPGNGGEDGGGVGTTIRKTVIPVKPSRDIKTRLLTEEERRRMAGNEEELKMVTAFVDLLEKMLVLNPEKRLTVKEAFQHAFITGKY